jgi:flagellar biosynthesis GTPase FlhF
MLLSIFFTIQFSLSAQEVATGELFSVKAGSVEFFNYEGPHTVIETDEQIRGIGRDLARGDRLTHAGKYRSTHVAPENREQFGADVIEILSNARVDHIDNVRRIISGYIAERYGYDRATSDNIALFTTYYNAVYRRNMEYFSGLYSDKVLVLLESEKAGIAVSYKEWPGNTQLIIPVSIDGGGAARIDADTVGGDEVVAGIREGEGDRGVDQRKDVVELREDQLEEDKAVSAAERDRIEEEKAAVEEEKAAVEAERAAIENRQEEVEGALAEAEPGSSEEEALRAEEETLRAEEQELAGREQQVEEREARVSEEEENLVQAEEEERQREESIGAERDRIAADEQDAITREEEAAAAAAASPRGDTARFSFLRVREEKGVLLSTMVLLNSRTGEEQARSAVNTIRGRRVYPVDTGYAAVVGVDEPPKTVRLMLLDGESLKVISESGEQIYGESWVLPGDGIIYAVASIGGRWKIASFREDTLEMVSTGSPEVNPDTVMTLAAGSLFAEDRNGNLLRLDPAELTIR